MKKSVIKKCNLVYINDVLKMLLYYYIKLKKVWHHNMSLIYLMLKTHSMKWEPMKECHFRISIQSHTGRIVLGIMGQNFGIKSQWRSKEASHSTPLKQLSLNGYQTMKLQLKNSIVNFINPLVKKGIAFQSIYFYLQVQDRKLNIKLQKFLPTRIHHINLTRHEPDITYLMDSLI